MTDTPIIARKAPFAVEVTAGKTYFWCACGRSRKQPFCDGSHKTTTLTPVKHVASKDGKHVASKDGKLWFCGCKQSAKAPLCDGSHKDV